MDDHDRTGAPPDIRPSMARSQRFLAVAEAVRRIRHDRQLLLQAIEGRSEAELRAAYHVAGGPLGDFCESLHDLVAHVLMWDEINLAVLAEASRARRHWSLDPQWETREAGQALNAGGVAAGTELPVPLLLHRFAAVRDALVTELRSYAEDRWLAPIPLDLGPADSHRALAQPVMTVPRAAPYWHAAIHLDRLAEVGAQ